MQVTPEDRPEFVKLLEELVEEGSIEVTKRGKYKPIEKEVLKGSSPVQRMDMDL